MKEIAHNIIVVIGVIGIATAMGVLFGVAMNTCILLEWLGKLFAPALERWVRRKFGDDVVNGPKEAQ